jgi:ppGpp synthetase/RelA/SpoT-type nucleotidyltranferase
MTTAKTADKLPNMHSTSFRGLPVVVEWPKGSVRVGKNPDGSEFRTEMKADYGYIPGTESAGDHERVDVYIGPDQDADYVYAVEQLDDDGEFDEYKIMLGFDSLESAEEIFSAHAGEERMGDISEMAFDYLFDMAEENREAKKEASYLHEGDLRAVGRGEKTPEEVLAGGELVVRGPEPEELMSAEGPFPVTRDGFAVTLAQAVKQSKLMGTYHADAYIGRSHDRHRLTLGDYQGVYFWQDFDASALDLGREIGDSSSAEEAKSKLQEYVFRLGGPETCISFPEGEVKDLQPSEQKFLKDVGVQPDIKPDSARQPSGKPGAPAFSEPDKIRLLGLGVKGSKHTVIDAFVKNYEHELDYFTEVANLAQDKLDQALQDAGIKAVVSARAKRPNRLEKKLRKRGPKKHYQTFRDIYDDIIDLAGVRVALYFPADRERVGEIIEGLFASVRPAKHFPEDRDEGDSLGYVATHYLVHLRPDTLRKKELRYADTQVEIQVASVLMHAWSEVAHDLVYKPEKGRLTEEEAAILGKINDLVQEGESYLERLQAAIEGRKGEELRFEIAAAFSKAARLADRGRGALAKPLAQWDAFARTRLAFLKAQRADTLDDQLKEQWKKLPPNAAPEPGPDDKFWNEAVSQIGGGRAFSELDREERSKVIALAQSLKQNQT